MAKVIASYGRIKARCLTFCRTLQLSVIIIPPQRSRARHDLYTGMQLHSGYSHGLNAGGMVPWYRSKNSCRNDIQVAKQDIQLARFSFPQFPTLPSGY